ncbi:MAG: RloB domain-containing protein [Victivallales bacterium]|nr:RloB domain-containing protein [Victivallales bacterium]
MVTNKYRLSAARDMFERPKGENTMEPKRLVFLSTEGFLTERCYFNNLNAWLRDNKSQFQIHVLRHRNDGMSSPRYVLDLLNECKDVQKKGILPFDAMDEIRQQFDDEEIDRILKNPSSIPKERLKLFKTMLLKLGIDYDYRFFLKNRDEHSDLFAVVLDRDRQSHDRSELELVWTRCREQGFGFYIANPCFEFWLFLHLWNGSPLSEEEKQMMLDNAKVSDKHTYMSNLINRMAHHSKRIGKNVFDKCYRDNIQKAIYYSSCFATAMPAILSELGTNIGELLALISSTRPTREQLQNAIEIARETFKPDPPIKQ